MKKLLSKEEIDSRLSELRDTLNNGLVSVNEEKKIIKEIDDLEKSLPLTLPLAALEKEMDKIREQKKF